MESLHNPHVAYDSWFEDSHPTTFKAAGLMTSSPSGSHSTPLAHASDPVKHHRVRSGCLTCRKRRVKCDETHPVCQRCKKGSRDCKYPDPKATTKLGTIKSSRQIATAGDDHSRPRQTTRTFEPSQSVTTSPTLHDTRHPSSTSANDSYPSNQGASQDTAAKPSQLNITTCEWSHLPRDVRFFLDYHRKHINNYHYTQRLDTDQFFSETILEFAITFEPLLYAVLAFSSYFYTLGTQDGKINTFLRFYQKSVKLLRKSLGTKHKRPEIMLLTILQLAAFEEVLGDWVNVVGHQHAAHAILVANYTPEGFVEIPLLRRLFGWYSRFDIFVGIIAGTEIKLDRRWHISLTEFYAREAIERPGDSNVTAQKAIALSRLFATDVATVFGKRAKGLLSHGDFMSEIENLKRELQHLKDETAGSFALVPPFIQDFPNAPPVPGNDDIVDATDPAFLLAGDRFVWNLIKLDYWGMELIFLGHLVQIDPSIDKMDVLKLALQICKMVQALEYASPGRDIIVATHVSVVVAATALPAVPPYEMWFRRKFALSECNGYVSPRALRKKMSEHWSSDVIEWWLPNGEGYTDFLRAVRALHDDRAEEEKIEARDDLRDMKGLFEAMSLESSRSQSDGMSDHTRGSSSKSTNQSTPFLDRDMFDDPSTSEYAYSLPGRDRSSSSDFEGWMVARDLTGHGP